MTAPNAPVTGVLEELRSLIEAEGGVLADALRPARDGSGAGALPSTDLEKLEVFAPLLAAGRRSNSDPRGYALIVESILEGYLLHYGRGRIVEHADADLRLLAGDHLYAFGLVRLASIGDLEAVEELSDLISLCAQAHAQARDTEARDQPWQLTAALWVSAVLAVTGGSWQAQRELKRAVSKEGEKVIRKVLDAAMDRARELDLSPQLEQALIAFHRMVGRELSTT